MNRFGGGARTTEIGVVHEHRFAFFFWNRWVREAGSPTPPALVTIDWHQDLCAPDDEETAKLALLNRKNDSEVALFAWSQLHPHNDGHVLAAAEAGMVGDVYVLCHQDLADDPDDESDRPRVRVFRDAAPFAAAIRGIPEAILDIDLDYFTRSPDPCGGGDRVRLAPFAEIERVLNPRTGVVAEILPHVVGITVAIEPEFCGGLRNAHRLLRAVDEVMFGGTLLAEDVRWRSGV